MLYHPQMLTANSKKSTAMEVLVLLEKEEEDETFELVLGDNSQVKIKTSLWEPHEVIFCKGRLFANINVVGNNVCSIEPVEGPTENR